MEDALQLLIALGVIAIGAIFFVRGLRDMLRGYRSRTWPSTTGVVTSTWDAELEYGSEYYVGYSYKVSGSTYRSSYPPAPTHLHSPGEEIAVYYNPSRPKSSVLERGIQWGMVIPGLWVGGGFILIFVGGYFGFVSFS